MAITPRGSEWLLWLSGFLSGLAVQVAGYLPV